MPHLGLSVELTGMRQTLHRDAEDEIQDYFGAPPLLLRYLPSEQQPPVRAAGLVSVGAGWRF